MKEIIADIELIAHCGLYCGTCKKYLTDRCKGCNGNEKAAWCRVRSCCIENKYGTCAECTDFADVADCKKYNNFMARLFGFIFRSDRRACIEFIRNNSASQFAEMMAEKRSMSIRR